MDSVDFFDITGYELLYGGQHTGSADVRRMNMSDLQRVFFLTIHSEKAGHLPRIAS